MNVTQIRFSLHLSALLGNTEMISPIALHQMTSLLNQTFSSFSRSLEQILAPRGFYPPSPPYFEIEIFPLTSALPSKRRSRGLSAFCSRYGKWTENMLLQSDCLFLGNLNWSSQDGAFQQEAEWERGGQVLKYWLAAVIFKKLLKTFSL